MSQRPKRSLWKEKQMQKKYKYLPSRSWMFPVGKQEQKKSKKFDKNMIRILDVQMGSKD